MADRGCFSTNPWRSLGKQASWSAPAGVALTSGADLQHTAAQNLIATAGNHADFSIARRFTLAAGELVSIFAQKLGLKLFAARGKVEIQAQSDEMRLLADKHMTITSCSSAVAPICACRRLASRMEPVATGPSDPQRSAAKGQARWPTR
ncbi:DUF2345 domain-containing protein [Cupriavidus basilensis]